MTVTNMQKEYTTFITIHHRTIPEAVRTLIDIGCEMLWRSKGAHFEEDEVGLGWDTEVRVNADYAIELTDLN